MVLAFVALQLRFMLHRLMSSNIVPTLASAAILGLAVSGMHYTAMRASLFYPAIGIQPEGPALADGPHGHLHRRDHGVHRRDRAFAASVAGRQWELAFGLKAEVARRQWLSSWKPRAAAPACRRSSMPWSMPS